VSATVLVAEDEPALLDLLAVALEGEGYRVLCARDGAAALARLVLDRPDLLLADERLPYLRGADLVAHLRGDPARAVPAIVMSAYAPAALPTGTPFLAKPFDIGQVLGAVARALAAARRAPAAPEGRPSAAALAALARRFVAGVLDRPDPAAIRALVHPLYQDHGAPALGGSGAASLHALLGAWRDAFPDLRVAAEDCFAGGAQRVAVRLVATGTHTGAFLGLAPTGRAIRVEGLALCRFHGGQLVEWWAQFDTPALVRQLDADPPRG
jgi:CheY-like chemotaxis protein